MSRGPGVVQRFILDYLAAGHPEPDGRGSMLGRYRPIGQPLWKIAAAYADPAVPGRSTMCSFGRAMATLRRAGLIEVRYKYKHPYLWMRHPSQSPPALPTTR
jgi:hypothetical protein